MKDFEGVETTKIEYIREQFKKLLDLYGFSLMSPSPIEMLSVLEAKSGPAIRDEIYYFEDKGKREVALRFDFTIGVTRYVTSQPSIKLPAKIACFGGVFRYDEPQKGRYRFFHQWDLEIYGKIGMETESEIIEMTARLFDSLGLENIVIYVNHRNLVESFIKKIFGSVDKKDLVADMLRAVDKIQKKSKDEIISEFEGKGYEVSKLEKILEFSQVTGTPEDIEATFDTDILESWDDLKGMVKALENRGIHNIRINFGIVRGLDYYSGMVFEVFDKSYTEMGALAGGGRYDSLTSVFGRKDMGAAGVAGGVERIALAMDKQGVWKSDIVRRVFVVYVDEQTQKVAVNIASSLRAKGIATGIDLSGRTLKKQMEIAAAAAFIESKNTKPTYVIIVAPNEIQQNKVILRNMQDKSETLIDLKKVADNPGITRLADKGPS